MAGMDISEKRLPQDGSILYTKKRLDIRVSVIPVLFGEKIVMRLLSSDSKILSLSQMGFSVDNLHLFKRLIKSSSGHNNYHRSCKFRQINSFIQRVKLFKYAKMSI